MTARIIATGPIPPHVEASLTLWHGDLVKVSGPSLAGVDFVVALPDAIESDIVVRARRAGVRIVEVC